MSKPHTVNIGVSWLRHTCAANLRNLENVMVIHDHLTPLAVMVPYEIYMAWQELLIPHPFGRDRKEKP